MFARPCLFLVGRPFSCSPAGRLSMRWVGPSSASLRLAPVCSRVRRGLLQRASCMSAELGGAHFLSSFSCMLVVSRANHPFQHVFPLFPTATRKCVCVCVCVETCLISTHCHLRSFLTWARHVHISISDTLQCLRRTFTAKYVPAVSFPLTFMQ